MSKRMDTSSTTQWPKIMDKHWRSRGTSWTKLAWSPISWTEKILVCEKLVAWSYDMEGHAQKCVERYCDLANKKVEQLYKVFKPLLGWSSIQARRTRICWRIVRSLLTNRLEMLVLSTNWTTWHSMVGQQACEISHRMDSGMWQTISKTDFAHASHKRRPTMLSRGKHGTTLQTGFVSRLGLCWWPWGLKVNHKRCLVYFWKQNICPNQLDVAQFYRVWDYFSGCRNCVWMGYLLLIFETQSLKYYVQPTTLSNPNILASRKLVRLSLFQNQDPKCQKKEEGWAIEWSGLCTL